MKKSQGLGDIMWSLLYYMTRFSEKQCSNTERTVKVKQTHTVEVEQAQQRRQGGKKLTCERIIWEVRWNTEQMETMMRKRSNRNKKQRQWDEKYEQWKRATVSRHVINPPSHSCSVLLDFLSTARLFDHPAFKLQTRCLTSSSEATSVVRSVFLKRFLDSVGEVIQKK